jgi:hypothetical protein
VKGALVKLDPAAAEGLWFTPRPLAGPVAPDDATGAEARKALCAKLHALEFTAELGSIEDDGGNFKCEDTGDMLPAKRPGKPFRAIELWRSHATTGSGAGECLILAVRLPTGWYAATLDATYSNHWRSETAGVTQLDRVDIGGGRSAVAVRTVSSSAQASCDYERCPDEGPWGEEESETAAAVRFLGIGPSGAPSMTPEIVIGRHKGDVETAAAVRATVVASEHGTLEIGPVRGNDPQFPPAGSFSLRFP